MRNFTTSTPTSMVVPLLGETTFAEVCQMGVRTRGGPDCRICQASCTMEGYHEGEHTVCSR